MTNDQERITAAIEHARQARQELDAATTHPDPVERRRGMERAALHYRTAANQLDAIEGFAS